jgi:hypothetical protein
MLIQQSRLIHHATGDFVTRNFHIYDLRASKIRKTWEASLRRNTVSHGMLDFPSESAISFGFTAQTWPRNGTVLYGIQPVERRHANF